jgi:hypothetical protein
VRRSLVDDVLRRLPVRPAGRAELGERCVQVGGGRRSRRLSEQATAATTRRGL